MSASWWASLHSAPRPNSPLLVVVVADDPEAVSALPVGFGDDWLAATQAGGTATARLAAHLDVPVHHATTPEIPAGHDLILLADAGCGLTTAAAVFACTHFQAEPQLVTGFGSGITDIQWMAKVADVRARSRQDSDVPPPIGLLARILENAADADLPVLLDGAVSVAAAAAAERLPRAYLPTVGAEPSQQFFLDRIEVAAGTGAGIGPGLGLGALSGLAILQLGLLAADV